MLIGSEVDVVAKMLCEREAPTQSAANIRNYKAILMNRFDGLHTIEVDIPRYKRSEGPWAAWGEAWPASPPWWTAYNSVKHRRDTNFQDANQGNVINALCGLMALLLYWMRDEVHLQPYPELLDYGFPATIVTDGIKALPGL